MSAPRFQERSPYSLTDNFFHRIGRDWMLITAAAPDGRWNTMTASWGTVGILWNKPVAVCFIRPQRYTYGIVEDSDTLTLSFFPKGEYREALRYCGTKSGRDGDKFTATGLTVEKTAEGTPYPAEANLVLVCRKLYQSTLQEDGFIDKSILTDNYPNRDLHDMYIGEIVKVLAE